MERVTDSSGVLPITAYYGRAGEFLQASRLFGSWRRDPVFAYDVWNYSKIRGGQSASPGWPVTYLQPSVDATALNDAVLYWDGDQIAPVDSPWPTGGAFHNASISTFIQASADRGVFSSRPLDGTGSGGNLADIAGAFSQGLAGNGEAVSANTLQGVIFPYLAGPLTISITAALAGVAIGGDIPIPMPTESDPADYWSTPVAQYLGTLGDTLFINSNPLPMGGRYEGSSDDLMAYVEVTFPTGLLDKIRHQTGEPNRMGTAVSLGDDTTSVATKPDVHVEIPLQVLIGASTSALRLTQRDDGLGISPAPRIGGKQMGTSLQAKTTSRIGGGNTYV